MIQPRIAVEITDPSGNVLDLTDRIDSGGLNSISEQVAEDLIELVHSDMDLELRDPDGVIESFFTGAEPEDVYEIAVVRDTLKRRPKCEKVFGGVLELPWSLRFNRKEQTVALQSFSYSKLLERTSAESVKRTIQAMTGSASSGAATVTSISPDTDDLIVGDTISLDFDEERVILTIDSSSQVTVTENWGTSYTTKAVTVLTPYYRNKALAFLVGELFDAASITDRDISIGQSLADVPVHQDMNDSGITAGDPRSLVEEAGSITATFSSGNRKTATSPSSGFVAGAADQDGQGDWRPYGDTEPATIVEATNATDDGTFAWDHVGGDSYTLNVNIEIDVPTPGLDTTTLELFKNGVYDSDLDTYIDGTDSGYTDRAHEWDGTQIVWSAVRTKSSTLVGDHAGAFAEPRRVEQMATTAWHHGGDSLDIGGMTIAAPGSMRVWTLRAFEGVFAALYFSSSRWRVKVWDQVTCDEVADHEIIAGISTDKTHMTVFDAGTENIAVGYVNNVYFILAKGFLGTIPYADFEGLSVSAALRELALISMSVFEVDRFKVGSFRGRGSALTNSDPVELDTPLDRETVPIWEFYKASVTVEGETEAGAEIEATVGATGDSARRLELSLGLVTTQSLAKAVADLYLSFLSAKRRQESVTVIESGTIHRTFDRVKLDGVEYMVLEPETELLDREQSMQLVTV